MLRTQCRAQHVTSSCEPAQAYLHGHARRVWKRLTFDKSPVRESRTPGSVGEALSNQRLYPTDFGPKGSGCRIFLPLGSRKKPACTSIAILPCLRSYSRTLRGWRS